MRLPGFIIALLAAGATFADGPAEPPSQLAALLSADVEGYARALQPLQVALDGTPCGPDQQNTCQGGNCVACEAGTPCQIEEAPCQAAAVMPWSQPSRTGRDFISNRSSMSRCERAWRVFSSCSAVICGANSRMKSSM